MDCVVQLLAPGSLSQARAKLPQHLKPRPAPNPQHLFISVPCVSHPKPIFTRQPLKQTRTVHLQQCQKGNQALPPSAVLAPQQIKRPSYGRLDQVTLAVVLLAPLGQNDNRDISGNSAHGARFQFMATECFVWACLPPL